MRKWIIALLIFATGWPAFTHGHAAINVGAQSQPDTKPLQSDSLLNRINQFREAHARRDYVAARSFLAPDARIWFEEKTGEGSPYKIPGRWEHWDTYLHGHTTYSNWQQTGNEITAEGHEINDYYRLLDWRPWPFKQTWWFNDQGQISGCFIRQVEGQGSTGSRLKEFKEWAKQNRPEELAYLMPKGSIDPSEDRPERWRVILVEWRKAVGLPAVELSR